MSTLKHMKTSYPCFSESMLTRLCLKHCKLFTHDMRSEKLWGVCAADLISEVATDRTMVEMWGVIVGEFAIKASRDAEYLQACLVRTSERLTECLVQFDQISPRWTMENNTSSPCGNSQKVLVIFAQGSAFGAGF